MRRYSDHLFREFFQIEVEDDPKDKLDLSRWKPAEADTFPVARFLMDAYRATLETSDEEAAQEYIDLYNAVKKRGLHACKDKIQGILCDYFWAVDGEIEEYYGDSPDILEMMNLTILKESVQV